MTFEDSTKEGPTKKQEVASGEKEIVLEGDTHEKSIKQIQNEEKDTLKAMGEHNKKYPQLEFHKGSAMTKTIEISALEKLKGNMSQKEKNAIDNGLKNIGKDSKDVDNFLAELGKNSGELSEQERQSLAGRFGKVSGYIQLELSGACKPGASDNYANLSAQLENAKKFNDPKMISNAEENLKKFEDDMKKQITEKLQKNWEISNLGKPVPTMELELLSGDKKTISQIEYLATNLSSGSLDVFSERSQRHTKTEPTLSSRALADLEIKNALAQRGIKDENEIKSLSNAMSNIESGKILRY